MYGSGARDLPDDCYNRWVHVVTTFHNGPTVLGEMFVVGLEDEAELAELFGGGMALMRVV
jgi:hypothetical protein